MKLHVLAGDSLIEPFQKTKIEGEMIVCRECLIDGDLRAESLNDLWNVRENYLSDSFQKPDNFYRKQVRAEFEKLLENADGSEINLWFEYELFCQINLWFCLWLLKDRKTEIFIIYPVIRSEDEIWNGFGYLDTEELRKSVEQRIKLSRDDILLGSQLFENFQNRNIEKLKSLGQIESKAFPTLEKVCRAAAEIEIRPKNTLQMIMKNGETNFGKVFQEFNRTEKIYGFGDLQVKKIYDELIA